MAGPPLSIQLLGTFMLRVNDQPAAAVNKPRLQALLAYLLLHRAAPMPRARIAAAFWPDTTDAQARTNLRNLIHALREALPPGGDYLLADMHSVGWNPDAPYRLDVADFEAAAAGTTLADWQAAVALYAGDLLPELYDDWAAPERERLRWLYAAALERLTDGLEAAGRHAEALAAAARLLRLDPLHEAYTIRLMRLNALAGDRAGVRRAYETLTTVLREEIGVTPSAETRAAFEQWLAAEPAPRTPPDTPARRRATLPLPADELFGREREVAEVAALLAERRLVTLTGYGGVGKTRLALAAASAATERFHGGACWVDLSPLVEGEAVAGAVAAALALREQAGRPLTETVIEFLGDTPLLLVLDNCEHVLAGVGALIGALLRDCPGVHVLATSRLRLRLPEEHVYAVGPLALPAEAGEAEAPAANPCMQLFVERATAVWPTFALSADNAPAVAYICRRLEGIPLAIELAAGRVRLLSPHQIAARLDGAFDLLATGLVQHRTLRGTLDWSYSLLGPGEKALLRRLSVFTGSFTLDAAEQVAAGETLERGEVIDLLAGLIDHSLVAGEEWGGERRHRFHEMTRQYALERLTAAGERERVMARLLGYVGALAREAREQLRGEAQAVWLRRLDAEGPTIETALEWGIRAPGDETAAVALRALADLYFYWSLRGHHVYAERQTERALAAVAGRAIDPEATARARATAAALAIVRTDAAAAREHLAVALADPAVLDPAYATLARHVLGLTAYIERDHERALAVWSEALDAARAGGVDWCQSMLLDDLGNVYMRLNDHERALAVFQEERAIATRSGDLISRFFALTNLGIVLGRLDSPEDGRPLAEEAVRLARQMDNPRMVAYALRNQARLALAAGRAAEALGLLREATALAWEIRNRDLTLSVIEQVALAAERHATDARAVALFSAVDAARRAHRLPPHPADEAATTAALARLREALTPAAFDRAWGEGQRLAWEEVVALAMAEV